MRPGLTQGAFLVCLSAWFNLGTAYHDETRDAMRDLRRDPEWLGRWAALDKIKEKFKTDPDDVENFVDKLVESATQDKEHYIRLRVLDLLKKMEAEIISPFAHEFAEIATTDDHHVVRQRALEVLHKIPEHALKHEDKIRATVLNDPIVFVRNQVHKLLTLIEPHKDDRQEL
mmetsp:Transcript_21311/g.38960  ORF Transcript_21311/g.38960 Transcript_21311/m.38960 type:complete len:172 (+) Transcript_21311:50-565(+)